MYIGGYQLDLYCDAESSNHVYREFPHQVVGDTFAQCRRKAQHEGWVFKRDGTVLCPKCSGKLTKGVSK